MNKKQTVFLSAILGIGSIMMLSLLIISATKANPDCVVSDNLTVTGNLDVGKTLRVPNNGIYMMSGASTTSKGTILGVKSLSGTPGSDLTISPVTGHKVSLGGNSRAVGNFEVWKDATLGNDSSDKVKAYQYCDENGNNCHDASGGWGGGIPSGFCMFSDTKSSCPSGWTRRSSFDGRTIRGSSSSGGTGGSDTHTHDVTIQSKYIRKGSGYGDYVAKKGTFTTDSASSWPPYMEVIICCKN